MTLEIKHITIAIFPPLSNVLLFFLLSVVLYSRETWSFALREECGLRIFEKKNSILKLIVGPKREYNGEWRWLHNEKLHS